MSRSARTTTRHRPSGPGGGSERAAGGRRDCRPADLASARQPPLTEPRSECYYVGRRSPTAAPEVFLVAAGVERLRPGGFGTAAEFDWGHDTPGARELAHAILNHALAAPPDEAVCRRFAAEVLCPLDPDGFVLSGDGILLWMLAAIPEAEPAADDRPSVFARATARVRRRRRQSSRPDRG